MDCSNIYYCGGPLDLWRKAFGHKFFRKNGCPVSHFPDEAIVNGRLNPEWRYDQKNGLIKIPYREWKTLEHTHFHEGITKHQIRLKTKGHLFLELIDNEGNGYSVGYSARGSYPLSWRRGHLYSPDESERKPFPVKTEVAIEISPEQFKKIKESIEKFNSHKEKYFHFMQENCTNFVLNLLRDHLDIDIDNREFLTEAMCRKMFNTFNLRPSNNVLSVLDKFGAFLRFFCLIPLSLLYLLTGAWHVPKSLNKSRMAEMLKCNPHWAKRDWKQWIIALVSVDFFKVYTLGKYEVWAQKVKKFYNGKELISVDEAQQIKIPSNGIVLV